MDYKKLAQKVLEAMDIREKSYDFTKHEYTLCNTEAAHIASESLVEFELLTILIRDHNWNDAELWARDTLKNLES